MTTSLLLLLLAAAVICWPVGGDAERRLTRLGLGGQVAAGPATGSAVGSPGRDGADGKPVRSTGPARWPRARRWLLSGVAGAAVLAFLGGPTGLVAALLASVASGWVLARSGTIEDRRRLAQRHAELPGALDLVGVCLRSGQPVAAALAQVAAILEGPLAADLAVAAAMHGLGADPRSAWTEWSADPVLAPVARCMSRTGSSGAALSRALVVLAEESRAHDAERAEVAARRVGVLVLAPLGLCFLPAFVCLGVVPTVLGIADVVLP
ncbi:MAG: type II secretion system F family protein [Geodermatophilaceae bacterium]|nr:type II secretion system F family protein [Geodermatophilaceae bacterium]